MLLMRIVAEPARFQKRDTLYSEKTVGSIVKEGVRLSKFDPLPLLPDGDRFIVGGDGHSRFEAICRLRDELRLPLEWKVGTDWDVPHKIVDAEEAKHLAWTGNMARDSFSAIEEAKVFQEMLDAGMDLAEVARRTHKRESYIREALPLNGLCHDIRIHVGRSPDAGGIEVFVAKALAERFARYGIPAQQQQELWHKVLVHADVTKSFVVKLLDNIGRDLAAKHADGLLFEVPASAAQVMKAMKGRADNQRRIERGLAWLMQAKKEAPDILGTLCPELKTLLDKQGDGLLSSVKQLTEVDAAVIGAFVTSPAGFV